MTPTTTFDSAVSTKHGFFQGIAPPVQQPDLTGVLPLDVSQMPRRELEAFALAQMARVVDLEAAHAAATRVCQRLAANSDAAGPSMSMQRAQAITAALAAAHLHGLGVGQAPDWDLLNACTLADFLHARDLVTAARTGAGVREPALVCEDRLIAAIHAALHYPAGRANSPSPIVIHNDETGQPRSALVHVLVAPPPSRTRR